MFRFRTAALLTMVLLAGAAAALLTMVLLAGAAAAQDTPVASNPHGDISLDCSLCHSEGSWRESPAASDFDHAATGFPLEGRHALAHCRDCHRDPRFAFVGTSCADCHADVHKGQLGPSCQDCHDPGGWVQRDRQRVAHDATSFPLVGAHSRVDCDACHTGALAGNHAGTPTDCYFCHSADYAATTNPDHQASGFGHDCLECHSAFTSTWGRGDFVHPASFPLTGAHGGLECAACHTGGFFGTASDCYACHQADYEGTSDPGHVSAGFPVSCSICHTTTAWEPATYNHDASGFPLTGAHRTADCLSCHQGGYSGTPSDCYACHQAEYDATSDPAHVSAGFPTGCASCHSTTAWEPSTWDHDTLFPIYSGRHRDEWNSCADCHLVPSNYAAFECIFCHEHNQTDTDRDHQGEGDYQYLSSACLDCHPDGSE